MIYFALGSDSNSFGLESELSTSESSNSQASTSSDSSSASSISCPAREIPDSASSVATCDENALSNVFNSVFSDMRSTTTDLRRITLLVSDVSFGVWLWADTVTSGEEDHYLAECACTLPATQYLAPDIWQQLTNTAADKITVGSTGTEFYLAALYSDESLQSITDAVRAGEAANVDAAISSANRDVISWRVARPTADPLADPPQYSSVFPITYQRQEIPSVALDLAVFSPPTITWTYWTFFPTATPFACGFQTNIHNDWAECSA